MRLKKIPEHIDIRDGFFDDLFIKYKQDKKIYFITSDQGALKLKDFINFDPNRCINVGIGEQNLILFASGLALCGNTVYVYAISSFLIAKTIEQIKVDLTFRNLNVKLIGSGTGFCYSADGPTHHILEDISLLRSYKNIEIYTPSNARTSNLISKKIYKKKGVSYVRLDKGSYNYENLYLKNKHYENYFLLSNKSNNNCIITYGVMTNYIFNYLNKSFKNYTLIDFYKCNPISKTTLQFLKKFKKILIIEESFIESSLFSILVNKLYSYNIKFISIGLTKNNYFDYGSREYLIKKNILNSYNKKKISDFFEK